MEFDSVVFLLRFLPLFLICYYLVPGRMKNFILLLGNLCFYSFGMPVYAVLILLVMTSDFCHGLLIERHRGKKSAAILTGNAIFFDAMILLLFGYADFGIRCVNAVFGTNLQQIGFPVPLGLTVFILQSLSYVIDVFRGRVQVQKNYISYATYVTLFPTLAGGPIVKYADVEDALKARNLDVHKISGGVIRFCVGLAKKAVLADVMGEVWMEVVKNPPASLSLGTAWLGVASFGLQVYFLYSGFADMAIGLGACLGFTFPENFKHPFTAPSITDFIKRWNISLTEWVMDYFYRPLLGEKAGLPKQIFLTFLSMALIGFWYGPEGTFLLWGIWIAFFYVMEKLFWKKVQAVLPYLVNWILTMLVISLGWVLFALSDFESALYYFQALFGQGAGGIADRYFWHCASQYFPYMVMAFIFALPHFSYVFQKLQSSRKPFSMALYRLLEKTVPALLLILSLLKIIGEG